MMNIKPEDCPTLNDILDKLKQTKAEKLIIPHQVINEIGELKEIKFSLNLKKGIKDE